MSLSNDISGLFKWIGGRPEQYQEIPHDGLRYADQERPSDECIEIDVTDGGAQGGAHKSPLTTRVFLHSRSSVRALLSFLWLAASLPSGRRLVFGRY